jgi:hypothetical protein
VGGAYNTLGRGGKVKRLQNFSRETYKKKSTRKTEIDADWKAMMVVMIMMMMMMMMMIIISGS